MHTWQWKAAFHADADVAQTEIDILIALMNLIQRISAFGAFSPHCGSSVHFN